VGSPVPEDALPISFAVTTTAPSASLDDLHRQHENLSSVCESMLPAHNAQAQDGAAPYTVTVSGTRAAPGDVVAGKGPRTAGRRARSNTHTHASVLMLSFYSVRTITPNLSDVKVRREGNMEMAGQGGGCRRQTVCACVV
jgi:hypothetical protein